MGEGLGNLGKEMKVASGEGGSRVNHAADQRALGASKLTSKLDGDMWECCLDWHWEDATRRGGIAEDRGRLRNAEEEDDGLVIGHGCARDGGRGGAGVGCKDSLTHLLLLRLGQVFESDGLVCLLALLCDAEPILVLFLGLGLHSRIVLARANNLFAPLLGVVAIATPATLGLLGGNIATVRWSVILSQGSLSLTRVGGNSARSGRNSAHGGIEALTQEVAGNILDLLYFILRSLCRGKDGR